VHLFRYSKRQGTPAAARTDQIDPQVKEDRVKRMEALADEVRRSFARELVGTREVVAVEGDGWGTTERFFKAKVDPAFPAGSLVTVSLTDVDGSGIFSTC
jgi:threonylcarbamoyladenosine tRNA methylthiotransferase MtaB